MAVLRQTFRPTGEHLEARIGQTTIVGRRVGADAWTLRWHDRDFWFAEDYASEVVEAELTKG